MGSAGPAAGAAADRSARHGGHGGAAGRGRAGRGSAGSPGGKSRPGDAAGRHRHRRGGAAAMMNNLLIQTVISYCLVFVVPLVLPIAFIKLVGLGGLRELVTYEAKDTPLHNLDPRLKVLYPIAMGILSILLTWTLMLAVFGLSLIPWFWLRPSRAKI